MGALKLLFGIFCILISPTILLCYSIFALLGLATGCSKRYPSDDWLNYCAKDSVKCNQYPLRKI